METQTKVTPHQLGQLKAEAARTRESYTRYRTKSYGPTQTSPSKLQLLKRNSILAKRRFDRAQADVGE